MNSAKFSGGDPATPLGAGPAPAGSPMPAVVGILIAGAAVLLLGLWFGRDGIGGTPGRMVPQITLVEPGPGAVADAGVRVVFETRGLVEAPEGWRAGRLHLHAVLDGVELMPAAADIEPLGEGRYAWRLAPLAAGAHTIQLRWSGPDHAPLAEGATSAVVIEVGSPAAADSAPPADGASTSPYHGAHTR